jgi:hypothetical protein
MLQLRPARRGIAAPSKLQMLQSCKTGIRAQKEPAGRQHHDQQGEHSSRNTQHPIDHSLLLFAALTSSNHHNKNRNSLQGKIRIRTPITSQVSQFERANNSATNARDDVFLAFTMVQQIMTELSGAATEK